MLREFESSTIRQILLALIALLLIACGTPITEGWVRDKAYTPARDWDTLEPVYEYICDYDYDYYNDEYDYNCTYKWTRNEWKHHHQDEYWQLKIYTCPSECKEGWVTVSEEVYNQHKVDDHWSKGS